MKKKQITRKEFISKTGKCMGGIVCTPMMVAMFHSCSKPDILNSITDDTLYVSECPCHFSQFDQNGDVIQGPAQISLTKYSANLSDDMSSIIIENSNEIILLSDHPSLLETGGVSHLDSIDIDSRGILLYRESEENIIVMSRNCTHEPDAECATIDPFQSI